MASQKKITIWVAVIGAIGVILAAVISGGFGLIGQRQSGNQIDQHSGSGGNIACQDHSTCNG